MADVVQSAGRLLESKNCFGISLRSKVPKCMCECVKCRDLFRRIMTSGCLKFDKVDYQAQAHLELERNFSQLTTLSGEPSTKYNQKTKSRSNTFVQENSRPSWSSGLLPGEQSTMRIPTSNNTVSAEQDIQVQYPSKYPVNNNSNLVEPVLKSSSPGPMEMDDTGTRTDSINIFEPSIHPEQSLYFFANANSKIV